MHLITVIFCQSSEDSRLNTASSEVEDAKEKDSVLDRSSSIFVSMSGSPAPKTPKTADTLAHGMFGSTVRRVCTSCT